jgi:ABC-type glycerol-3-phosphate transport system permease component
MAGNTTPFSIKSKERYQLEHLSKAVLAYSILAIVVLFSLYPIGIMVVNSFKSNVEVNINPSGLPQNFTFEDYSTLFEAGQNGLFGNYLNSLIISVTSTVLAVFFAALAGFAFAKYRFVGRDFIFGLLLATTFVPTEINIPPLYLLFARIDWLNTLQVQILPSVVSVFGLFLVRQYMLTIPDALLQAAKIDGANHWQSFWLIALPLSSPVLGAFAILHFLGMWNSYLWPIIMASKRDVAPISIVLPSFTDAQTSLLPQWGTIMAGCVLSILPIVIIFVLFQDKFMSSVVVGAVKE